MKHIRWIWRFWQPHRPWLYLLALLTLLSSAVAIAYPQVLRYLIDTLQKTLSQGKPEEAQVITYHLVGLIALIGLARSMSSIYPGVRAWVNARIEMGVRSHYFGAILNKGYRFFQRFRTGDLVTRLTDDIGGFPKIAWFCCSGIFRAVESGSKFLFCMAVMLWMNWHLAVLAVVPLPIMLWIFYRLRVGITRRALERQRIISTTNDALEAAFSGIRILKAFRGEENQSRAFQQILDERIRIELNLTRLWFGVMNLYWAIQFVGQTIVIVAGGLMVIKHQLTTGEFYAFYVYLSMLLPPLMDIPNLFVTSRQAFACIDREIEIEEAPGGTEAIYSGTAAVSRLDAVELQGISFRYRENLPWALQDISLSLKRGERAAVVGQVGSGKSTLLKALAGMLPPQPGTVLVNGRPLAEYSLPAYRKLTGYIPQEATLFSESVADNVSFGRGLDRAAVEDGLKLAQVFGEMAALPKGLDQVLGQRGLTISGGQKQRLAIARALAGGPDLLLMDDCTSALDAENERAFWDEFSRRNPEAACLIVTHRLATARQASMIYVLEQGRIVGRGTHEELLASCEAYQNFTSRAELQNALTGNGNNAAAAALLRPTL